MRFSITLTRLFTFVVFSETKEAEGKDQKEKQEFSRNYTYDSDKEANDQKPGRFQKFHCSAFFKLKNKEIKRDNLPFRIYFKEESLLLKSFFAKFAFPNFISLQNEK